MTTGKYRFVVVSVFVILLLTLALKLPMFSLLQSFQGEHDVRPFDTSDITLPPVEEISRTSIKSSVAHKKLLPNSVLLRQHGGHNQMEDISNYPCNDELCTQFLEPADLSDFHNCPRHMKKGYRNGTCRFLNGSSRRVVALASFPGSGNTWVRGLLEKAAGICTGSVYCDPSLRGIGFNGEGVSSSAVLAVKTHETLKPFQAAIHLVRCPADAIVSEWNRKQGIPAGGSKHKVRAPQEAFGVNEEWEEFVQEWSRRWGQAALRVARYQHTHPLLRVFFEDLRTNTSREVVRILDFLGVPYSHSQVEQKLNSGFNEAHRESASNFEHFTDQQKRVVGGVLSHVVEECSTRGYKDTRDYVLNYLSTCIL